MEMSWYENKIVLCGPYVGDIRCELLTFQPFVQWLKYNFYIPNIVVSTHYNRSFLYQDENIPIFKQYSKNELDQVDHKHKKLNNKDYLYLTNEIKDIISKKYKYNKSDIIIYNLGYSSSPWITHFHKKFEILKEFKDVNGSDILFIPCNNRPYKEIEEIFEYLITNYNIEIIGDQKIFFNKYNHLLDIDNYFDYLYELLIGKILTAKAVICPTSHWTALCNLHNIPVFSWNENVNMFKSTYRFNNEWCTIIPSTNPKSIIKGMKKFISEVKLC